MHVIPVLGDEGRRIPETVVQVSLDLCDLTYTAQIYPKL